MVSSYYMYSTFLLIGILAAVSAYLLYKKEEFDKAVEEINQLIEQLQQNVKVIIVGIMDLAIWDYPSLNTDLVLSLGKLTERSFKMRCEKTLPLDEARDLLEDLIKLTNGKPSFEPIFPIITETKKHLERVSFRFDPKNVHQLIMCHNTVNQTIKSFLELRKLIDTAIMKKAQE